MRLTLVTAGSRGDVQPYVALARGLADAGFVVTVATHETFRDFVTGWGLGFAPVVGDPRAMLRSDAGQRWLASGRNVVAFARELRRLAAPLVEPMLADYHAAVRDADVLVFSVLGMPSWHVAEQRGIPAVGAFLQPLTPTGDFPAIGFPPTLRLGRWLNRLSHHVGEQLLWQPLRPRINRWRRDALGLAPEGLLGPGARMHATGVPVVYGISPHVLPPPSDWNRDVHVGGYWFLGAPPAWEPPPALARFLADGPPPVYVGFGSMTPRDADALTRLALDALAQAGARGVLLRGWGGLGDGALPDSVLVVDDVPHEWLFPRMAAVVHHGGAGTTAAGLRAGVPSIVTPLFADQPYWGERVRALGVGPAPIHRASLTAERLASAIRRVLTDAAMRARAARLGAAIRAEDGVERAVAVVQETVRRHAARA